MCYMLISQEIGISIENAAGLSYNEAEIIREFWVWHGAAHMNKCTGGHRKASNGTPFPRFWLCLPDFKKEG